MQFEMSQAFFILVNDTTLAPVSQPISELYRWEFIKLGDRKISHNMELYPGKSKTRMGSCTWSTHPRRHLAEQILLEHLRVGEEDLRRQKKQNWSKTQKPKTCILFTKTYASPERTFLLIVFSVANFILYVKTCIRLWIMSHHANKFYIHIKSSSVFWPA